MPVRLQEILLVVCLGVILVLFHTYPYGPKMHRGGRLMTGDGQFSIWNVAWVSRALVLNPTKLYNTNIFYPHRGTLAYSESNIGAGILGLPGYWLSGKNAYVAHNSAMLLGFLLTFITTYALARYLTHSLTAAVFAAIAFTFCPYIFARTAHMQLMLPFGIPGSLWLFHRYVDRPSLGRATALGLMLFAQALSCAYYAIFAGMIIGFATLYYALARRSWLSGPYWSGIAVAGAIAVGLTLPFFWPYLELQSEAGFARDLVDARRFSANMGAWLASSAWTHRWMLTILNQYGGWSEVLFPGFITTILGVVGLFAGLRTKRAEVIDRDVAWPRAETALRLRETTIFYGVIAGVAFWASFGPNAGLYTFFHYTIPIFSFLRAPARFGIIVALCLVIFATFVVAHLSRRPWSMLPSQWPAYAPAVALCVLMSAELTRMPLPFNEAERSNIGYRLLASMPVGPVAEFPFFSMRSDFPRHAYYMLASTTHWLPLINGYSDHIPRDFRDMVDDMSHFPTRAAFQLLKERRARYVIFHLYFYDRRSREGLIERINRYGAHLAPLSRVDDVWIYEVTSWPGDDES